jgi:hypothetical protein
MSWSTWKAALRAVVTGSASRRTRRQPSARRTRLGVEALETRDLMSASLAPSVFVRPNGEADFVTQGANNSLLYYYNRPGIGWSSTMVAGPGTTFSAPSLFVRPSGEADIVAQGANNSLMYYFAWPGSAWNCTQIAGSGTTFSAPSVTVRATTGEADVVSQGPNNSLRYYFAWPGSAWNCTQVAVSGTTFSAPAISVRPSGEADIVAQGSNNSLMYFFAWPGTNWSCTQIAGSGTTFSAPSLFVRPSGEADVAVLGANCSLSYYYAWPGQYTWFRSQVAGAWTATSAPSVFVGPDGVAYVTTQRLDGTADSRNTDGSLTCYSASPGGSWSMQDRYAGPTPAWSPVASAPYRPVTGTLFGPTNLPRYTDVRQGGVGDCWLLSGLAEVAARAPQDIVRMFTCNGTVVENGALVEVYTVRFFNSDGVAKYVQVDAELPSGGYQYDQPQNGVLWVALAEKAYAKANGACLVTTSHVGGDSYEALDGGWPKWALQAITGNSTASLPVAPFNAPSVASAWTGGQLIVLCTSSPSSPLIVERHCYAVVGYDPSSSTPFELYNPWGDDSSVIGATTEFEKRQVYGGVFWASWATLYQNFTSQTIGVGAAATTTPDVKRSLEAADLLFTLERDSLRHRAETLLY